MKLFQIKGIRILLFVAGLLLLIYSPVSNRWNNRVQRNAILAYEATVEASDSAAIQEMLTRAEAYNQALGEIFYPLVFHEQVPGYEELLNLERNGMMGVVRIEKIHVSLPIYHTESGKVPARAVGHLPGSSLPVGGAGTHSILCAHYGRPSARLFTDLDQLQEGDQFSLTVLDRVLTYQVDQIRIVDAEDVSETAAVAGKDYCTLMTCVPGWFNDQRMLVRGIRVEPTEPAPGTIHLREKR